MNQQNLWNQLEATLERICQKEAVLTAQMRELANRADSLMDEVALLKDCMRGLAEGIAIQAPSDSASGTPVFSPLSLQGLDSTLNSLDQAALLGVPPSSANEATALPGKTDEQEEVLEAAQSFEGSFQVAKNQLEAEPIEDSATHEAEPTLENDLAPQAAASGRLSHSGPDLGKWAPQASAAGSSLKNVGQFELDLGVKWLSRLGIVALLVGLAMALSYSFPHFTSEMKILTGVIISVCLFFGGGKLQGRSPILGRILEGGGLSVGYLSLFAVFFIPEVRLVDFDGLGLVLLFGYVGLVLALAHRMKSQTVALLSLAFGYYTATYADAYWVAFITTMALSVGTVLVSRLHPNWYVLPKANLLGAFLTYSHCYKRDGLHGDLAAQVYLLSTFMLFHIVSLLRGKDGDWLLNQANSLGFYLLYSATQPILGVPGALQFYIAGVQLLSLWLCSRFRPESRENGLSQGLLVLAIFFTGLGTLKYFETRMMIPVLVGEALMLGWLSARGHYKTLLTISSYLFYLLAYALLLFTWTQLPDLNLMLTVTWMTGIAFVLEATVFRKHLEAVRALLLIFATLLFWGGVLSAVPAAWQTITFVLAGFIYMAAGLFCGRKTYRWLGLGWIFLIGGLSLLGHLHTLDTGYKILLFILLGIGLLAGSYGYTWLEKRRE